MRLPVCLPASLLIDKATLREAPAKHAEELRRSREVVDAVLRALDAAGRQASCEVLYGVYLKLLELRTRHVAMDLARQEHACSHGAGDGGAGVGRGVEAGGGRLEEAEERLEHGWRVLKQLQYESKRDLRRQQELQRERVGRERERAAQLEVRRRAAAAAEATSSSSSRGVEGDMGPAAGEASKVVKELRREQVRC
jgi:hypothetical protein